VTKSTNSLQQELRFDEQFLNNVFDAIQDGISVLNPDLTIIHTNKIMEKMYANHLPPKGKKCFEVYQERKSICPWCPPNKTLLDGKRHTEIVPYPSEYNPIGWIELSSYPMFDKNGKVAGVIENVKDITDRKYAEEVEKTLYNISQAVNTVENSYDLYDKIREYLGRIIDTSNFFIGLYDEKDDTLAIPYDVDEKDEFIQLSYYKDKKGNVPIIPLKKTITAHVIRTGESLLATNAELKKMQKSGVVEGLGTLPEIWLGVPLKINDKVIGAIVVQNYHDPATYTEREKNILSNVSNQIALSLQKKQAYNAVRDSEEKYRKLLKNSNDVLVIIDKDARETFVSESVENLTGFSVEEFIGTKGFEHIHPDDVQSMKENLYKLIENPQEQVRAEYRHRHKDGFWIDLEAIGTNYFDDPLINGIVLNVRDITERKKADEALRKSEEKYRKIVSSMSDLILIHDKENRYSEVHCKPDFSLYLKPEEFLGKRVKDTMPIHISKKFEELAKEVRKTGEAREMEYSLVINNKELWFSGTMNLYADKESIVFDIKEITPRKQAEKIQKTLYNISHAVNTVDNIQDLYWKIREYLGEVIDTKNFYVVLYNEITDTISLPFEVDEMDNYETFPAGKTLTSYVIKTGEPLFATKKLQDELAQQGKIEIIGSRSEIWVGIPLKSDGKVIGALVVQSYDNPKLYSEKDIEILTFISEEIVQAIQHKQADEKLKKELKEKKVLLREIHHRVKNNLQTICGLLQLQQYKIETKEDAIKGFEVSQDRILAMAKAYETLLESKYMSDVGIGEYIKSIAEQLKGNYDIHNKVEYKYSFDEVIIDTDRLGKIGLVINEIITNAMKYAFLKKRKGKIKITLKDSKENIEICISDNGSGIPKEVKVHNPDTLGLSLVEMLVTELEGTLTIKKDRGASFNIVIPKVREHGF